MAVKTSATKRSGCELVITRTFDAPRELLWKLWTDPEHVKHWWGPEGFSNTIDKMDVRVGGEWEFVMHGPDGRDYKNKSVYTKVEEPELLMFDHVLGPRFQVTVTFAEQGKKTLLTWRMVFESAEQLDRIIKENKADKGLEQNIVRLEDYIRAAASGEVLVVERTYDAPVEKVWKAITDKDQIKQWSFDIKEFKPQVGFEFQFYGGTEEKQYLHLCKVLEVVPFKRLKYSWRYDGYDGNSVVTFELFADRNKTKVRLTHEGLGTFPKSNPDFAKKNFEGGWKSLIGSLLKEFVER